MAMQKAYAGMQGSMVPATFISRTVKEGETVASGAPVQLDGERRQVIQAVDGDGFEGVHCPVNGNTAEALESARIITQGVVYVEVAATVAAGDEVGFTAAGKWGTASATYKFRIKGAKFDDAGTNGDLVPVRLMGTEIEVVS